MDGPYENAFLTVGTVQDRSAFTRGVSARKLNYGELESLYEGDGILRRIVDLPAEEMFRAGYRIEGVDDSSEVSAALDGIDANKKLCDAVRWSRLYGGALVVALLNDGGNLLSPLRDEAVKEVEQLRVYDRWQVAIQQRYDDPMDKRYGRPMIYHISPPIGTPYQVHESRCLVFDGQPVPERIREENDGWGASFVQQCFSQLVNVNMSHYWANGLMERAQQAVHGIPELSNLLRSPGGEEMVKRRINMVDMARSVNNTVVIDAAETYELKSTSFASIADIIDRLGNALCAVSGIPESLLFGKPQSGLNASGKSDLENWYAKIGQAQEQTLLPALDVLIGWQLTAMGQTTEDYEIKFEPMYLPSKKDKAEADYKRAQTFELYVNMGAMDAGEVREMLPEEGYEIENPEELPEPSPEEIERSRLELEAMALTNKTIGQPKAGAVDE
jgi:phage-related protein (TIGR01555 family)